eukprot:COSAG01_NODE_7_length_54400_cov_1218.054935_22_plen_147_part_00
MKILLQRVKQAEVKVSDKIVGQIKQGLLVFFCAEKGDTKEKSLWLARKCINLKIFPDQHNKNTLNVNDIKGEVMIISQFTLAARCNKGNKADYSQAATPEQAKELYEHFIETCEGLTIQKIQRGIFSSYMEVSLVNDGPTSLIIKK